MNDRLERYRKWLPWVLCACVGLVVVWELMAHRARNPFRPFDLTSENFRGFVPQSAEWSFRPVPLNPDPLEPNIVAFEMVPRGRSQNPAGGRPDSPVLVRLVHGYNMVDCMRIKGYAVKDMKAEGGRLNVGIQKPGVSSQKSETQYPAPSSQKSESSNQKSDVVGLGSGTLPLYQSWLLTSPAGDVSVWVTSMLRANDFSLTDLDVRSMPFPRVGVPDELDLKMEGVTRESLRHPWTSFRTYMRSRWNGARCDLLTFLRLRQPVWASGEIVVLVSQWKGAPVEPGAESAAAAHVAAAQSVFHGELVRWSRKPE